MIETWESQMSDIQSLKNNRAFLGGPKQRVGIPPPKKPNILVTLSVDE